MIGSAHRASAAVGPADGHRSPSIGVAIATQYGPGFYGQRTACGQKLRPTTIGVANRTLKCGTQVAIYWHGRP